MFNFKSKISKKANEVVTNAPKLALNAEKLALSILSGNHGTKFSGIGENFWQFRNYEFGDPTSLIDWRKTASLDKVYIREKEREISQSFNIFYNNSNSMNFSSKKELMSKLDFTRLLILSISIILIKKGEKILFEKDIKKNTKQFYNMNSINEILFDMHHNFDYKSILEVKPKSQIIFFSDLYIDSSEIEHLLNTLSSKEIKGTIVQILDPIEKLLPFRGNLSFESLEDKKVHNISDLEAVKDEYYSMLQKHKTNIQKATDKYGWSFISHCTDEEPILCIINLLKSLTKKRVKFA